jgi:tetratricopeptide (TPR) repeat protein
MIASPMRCAVGWWKGGYTAAVLLTLVVSAAGAEESGTALAVAALAVCRATDDLPLADRATSLERGLALAEQAVETRPDDPVAHFAVFCNLGRRVQLEGLSARLLGDVRRLRRHIDQAVELAPDWPDALAGKGAFLLALPGLLGGDRDEGERLLRRAVELDPTNVEARSILYGASVHAASAALDE